MSTEAENHRNRLAELATAIRRPDIDALAATHSGYAEAARLAALGVNPTLNPYDSLGLITSREAINNEIHELRRKIAEAKQELDGARQKGKQSQNKITELQALVDQLRIKEDLGFLLTRVNSKAQEKLLSDGEFREIFAEDRDCHAFVMSVDIRRSTELMLKARTPSAFADFISRLTQELYSCVVENHGVFDKFTGDGILCFFPDGFSGEDAPYSVVKAASECHDIFQRIYKANRGSFTSVLTGIGLGIGIDYGLVRLLRVAEGLTVVGVPVVYACRMSGANPGHTLINQPAYEVIGSKFGKHVALSETTLDIKHEGEVLAYDAKLSNERYEPALPSWCDL